MSILNNLASMLSSIDIKKLWDEAEVYGKIRLHKKNMPPRDLPDFAGKSLPYVDFDYEFLEVPKKLERIPGQRGPAPFAASKAKGVYGWFVTLGPYTLYIGKTDAPSASINSRQGNHLRSFLDDSVISESSGRKFREFLTENGLQSLEIVIKYINTSQFNIDGMAEYIEGASIKHFRPKVNREIRGRGTR